MKSLSEHGLTMSKHWTSGSVCVYHIMMVVVLEESGGYLCWY